MLNDVQRDLVEKNHNLIYSFCYKHHLNLDDYYDVLALALCKAAMDYDETKSKFSTFAYINMKGAVALEIRSQNAMKRIPKDKVISINKLDNLIETEEEYMTQLEFMDILERFPDKEIVLLKIKGYNQTEIAEKVGVSQVTVSRRLKEFEDLLNDR